MWLDYLKWLRDNNFCPRCNGTGQIQTMEIVHCCDACQGTGKDMNAEREARSTDATETR